MTEEETGEQFSEPEPNITAFLNVIEAFAGPMRESWLACDVREFNLGYDCGDEPWAFNHGLTAVTLARTAALGISLRITLYPAEQTDQAGRVCPVPHGGDPNAPPGAQSC